MSTITDEVYWNFSEQVYENTQLKTEAIFSTKQGDYTVIGDPINNEKSGLQAVILASDADYKKIQNGQQPDHLIFVSRGTESLNDWSTNFKQLGSYPNIEKLKKDQTKDHQFLEYDNFVKDKVATYKPKDYSFTGHSLGGALAQYEAVLHDKKATTFAAAKPYRILPEKYQKLADSGYFDDKIIDHRHTTDIVPHVPLGHRIGSSYIAKKNVKNLKLPPFLDIIPLKMASKLYDSVKSHLGDSFNGMFDSNGKILRDVNKTSQKQKPTLAQQMNQAECLIPIHLERFSAIKKQLQASGSGLSSNEKLFIDINESLIVLDGLLNIVTTGVTSVIKEFESAILEASELWNDTIYRAQKIGENLSYGEVLAALEQGGATKATIVDEPVAYYESQITKAKSLQKKYEQLITQAKTGVEDLVASDNELANLFR
ncbi:lipase family protein [Bacillus nitratireducens]|uniref:lipase family protein n=1 Tax=Bacillus nitratireducens TaxID=2026193 RepID=UPI000BF763DB|nr:hypothetical protein [Bacillus nitratireducens]PFJ75537.1 hypothetical protein COI95_21015 [Bacillus cereus]